MQQLFCGKVTSRRVVLVQCVHRDTIGRRAGGSGQALAKGIVPLVSDSDPIDRAQDNRIAGAEQDDASAPQSQLFDSFDVIIGHHETDRRRRIDVKGSQL